MKQTKGVVEENASECKVSSFVVLNNSAHLYFNVETPHQVGAFEWYPSTTATTPDKTVDTIPSVCNAVSSLLKRKSTFPIPYSNLLFWSKNKGYNSCVIINNIG